jgi:hypothetical protein
MSDVNNKMLQSRRIRCFMRRIHERWLVVEKGCDNT